MDDDDFLITATKMEEKKKKKKKVEEVDHVPPLEECSQSIDEGIAQDGGVLIERMLANGVEVRVSTAVDLAVDSPKKNKKPKPKQKPATSLPILMSWLDWRELTTPLPILML